MNGVSTFAFFVLLALGAFSIWHFGPVLRRSVGYVRRLLGATQPRHPIVLAHGLLGFDELVIAGRHHTYFKGITEYLRAQGIEVHVARVDPTADIAQRAAQLAEQVRKIPARRVNIIAHSMGGLDARYAIGKLGLSSRVASLTTIGTPHHGTPLADHGVTWIGDLLGARTLLERLGIASGAFYNLTTTHLSTFNAEVQNQRGVYYASVVGRSTVVSAMHPVLRPVSLLLSQWGGDNDGLVPASSQAWGHVLLEVDACHFSQIGWLSSYDPTVIFAQIVNELVREGC
jgi:triacylglycerol lipase